MSESTNKDKYGQTCLDKPGIPTVLPLSIAERFLQLENELCQELNRIQFTEPVNLIYNPLEYASDTHMKFVHRFCNSEKKVLFLGMNAGSKGMGQTGIPFGNIDTVRNWLKIDGIVRKPPNEHPKIPIVGLEFSQNEVSGQRFWNLFKSVCGTPEVFFKDCFVHNICPLLFMRISEVTSAKKKKRTVKNVTPNKLIRQERERLLAACNHSLIQVVQLLQLKLIIGIGNFAYENALKAKEKLQLQDSIPSDFRIEKIMHPSPANPKANNDWQSVAQKRLKEININVYTNWNIT